MVNTASAPVRRGRAEAAETAEPEVPVTPTSAAAAAEALMAVRTWVTVDTPDWIWTLIALPETLTTSAPAVPPVVKAMEMLLPAEPIRTAVRVRP